MKIHTLSLIAALLLMPTSTMGECGKLEIEGGEFAQVAYTDVLHDGEVVANVYLDVGMTMRYLPSCMDEHGRAEHDERDRREVFTDEELVLEYITEECLSRG